LDKTKIFLFVVLFISVFNSLLFAQTDNNSEIIKKYNKYDNLFQKVASEYNLPWFLLKSIAITENHKLNPKLVQKNTNHTYDIGLMQINSTWIKKLKNKFPQISFAKLKEPYFNIKIGAYILKQNIENYGYSWKSVSFYHSFTKKYRIEWLKRIKNNIKYLAKYDKRIKIVKTPDKGYF